MGWMKSIYHSGVVKPLFHNFFLSFFFVFLLFLTSYFFPLYIFHHISSHVFIYFFSFVHRFPLTGYFIYEIYFRFSSYSYILFQVDFYEILLYFRKSVFLASFFFFVVLSFSYVAVLPSTPHIIFIRFTSRRYSFAP